MLQVILYNLDIALDAIRQNTLRSLLTSLGIIFGVGSVIAMLAIGSGAQEEVLQQMQLLGTNNVIIEPVIKQVEGQVQEAGMVPAEQKRYSPGLTLEDMQSIQEQIPEVVHVSPEIVLKLLLSGTEGLEPANWLGLIPAISISTILSLKAEIVSVIYRCVTPNLFALSAMI